MTVPRRACGLPALFTPALFTPVLFMIALAGCGGSAPGGPKVDQAYVNAMEVGRDVFDQSHPEQAEGQFQTAYRRALLGDDASAIRDAGYNRAVAQLDADAPEDALATIAQVRRDLALRNAQANVALDAVAMAAYVRTQRYGDAVALADSVSGDAVSGDGGAGRGAGKGPVGHPALDERLLFLRGLAEDGLGRHDALAAIVAAFPAASGASLLVQADRAELEARLALASGAWEEAGADARTAIETRRNDQDYRGLARALDCAARAAKGAGDLKQASAYEARAAETRKQLARERPHRPAQETTGSDASRPGGSASGQATDSAVRSP